MQQQQLEGSLMSLPFSQDLVHCNGESSGNQWRNYGNAMLLSSCICMMTYYLSVTTFGFASMILFTSAGLSAFWWDDLEKPQMAIPFFVLVLFVIVSAPFPDFFPDFFFLNDFVPVPVPVMSAYWFVLFQGFVYMTEGSGSRCWRCLFSLTLVYTCGTPNFCNLEDQITGDANPIPQIPAFLLFCLGLAYYLVQMARCIYLKLTLNMHIFMVIDVLSMLTFSVYTYYLSDSIAKLVAHVCLITGWTLSLGFLCDFLRPLDGSQEEIRKELDRRLQRACRISVGMDVGGKVFTYFVVLHRAEPNLKHCKLLVALEFLTTLLEAMQKWAHAIRAHAREMPAGAMASYLLGDPQPTSAGCQSAEANGVVPIL